MERGQREDRRCSIWALACDWAERVKIAWGIIFFFGLLDSFFSVERTRAETTRVCGLSIQSNDLLPEDLEAIPGLVADGSGLGERAERAHCALTTYLLLLLRRTTLLALPVIISF